MNNLISITRLENGNLSMKCERGGKTMLRKLIAGTRNPLEAEAEFIDSLRGDGFERAWPEDYACLTSAPIIRQTDDVANENPDVWGYMDYAVWNFIEQLAEGKTVIWTKG